LSGDERPEMVPPAEGEEEWRKRLLTVGLSGRGTLIVDNATGHLDSKPLCGFLTAVTFSDRLLGQSKSVSVPTNVLFVVTGNNTSLSADLARRILMCRIDPQMERPYTRSFAMNPARFIAHNRQDLVRAALVLIRAHWLERRPHGALASYEVWDAWVRQCVLWIGEPGWLEVDDPVATIEASQEHDAQKLQALIFNWWQVVGDQPVRVAELIKIADCIAPQGPKAELYDALNDIAGERQTMNSRRLGRWIERHRGRVCGGYRIDRARERSGSALWKVSPVQGGF
jgi:hypothetical protein